MSEDPTKDETPQDPPPEETPETPPAPPVDEPPVDPAEEEPADPDEFAHLIEVDGVLGPKTIKRWKEAMSGSPDKTGSLSPKWVKYLQAYLAERVDHTLKIDGKIEKQGSLTFSPTIASLQRYLKAPVNGKFTERSHTVVALQRRLNEGWF